MKSYFVLIVISVIFSSCGPCYQVFHLQPEKAVPGVKLVFENNDIKVGYNFWKEYGNSGFAVYNKTDKPIYLDLGNTHLVINDVASTYFQNRSHTSGTAVKTSRSTVAYGTFLGMPVSAASGSSTESTNSQTVNEVRVIAIPPKSMKIVGGFFVNQLLYNKDRFAENKKARAEFTQKNTPLTVKNIVTYRFDESDEKANIQYENLFWVKTIGNYKQQDVQGMLIGDRNFYIRYMRAYIYENPNSYKGLIKSSNRQGFMN